MKYDDYGTIRHRNTVGTKKIRLICIFLLVAAAAGTVIYLTLPKKTKAPVPVSAEHDLKTDDVRTETSVLPAEEKHDLAKTVLQNDPASEKVTEGQGTDSSEQDGPEEKAVKKQQNTAGSIPEKGVPGPGDVPPEQDKPQVPEEKNTDQNIHEKISMIEKLYAAGDFSGASAAAQPLLKSLTDGSPESRKTLELLSNSNWQRFVSRDTSGGFGIDYTVAGGDYLGKIAGKHKTTVAAVMKANRLKNTRIRIGQTLFLLPGSWKITVSKQKRQLILLRDQKVFMGFDVGIGRAGKTPSADFVILDRLKKPVYRTADGKIFKYGEPGNELGEYFLKLASSGTPGKPLLGYGIHGTPDESTVTRSLSNGCIRMRNADVERLYYIVPAGTPVEIRD